MKHIKYWYVGGDIHGDWRPIRNWVVNELKTPKEESALILLGDVGANYFGNKHDQELKWKLNSFGVRIYCLRGNHEMRVTDAARYSNYNQFLDEEVGGPVYVEQGYPNIYYFRDNGDYYIIGQHKTLIVPGAYSVDKNYRLQMGWNWFPNEQLDYKEQERLLWLAAATDFDYILAHTCPYSWESYINDLFMGGLDQSMIDKTTEKFLDKLLEECTYKHFYFGHFHDNRDILFKNATMLFHKIIPLGSYLNKQVDE